MGPTPCKPRPAKFVSIFKLLGVQFSGLNAVRALRPEEQGSAALEQCVFYRGGSFGKIQASRVEKASIEMLQPLASG